MTHEAQRLAPTVWSFSALRDARECPRRWALRASGAPRAAPTASGSSATPGIGLIRGRVVHAALERMLDAHSESGGPAWGDPRLIRFWSRHFPKGVPGVVREEAERELRRVTGAGSHLDSFLRREVDEALPSLAASVSALLRMTLSRAGSERCSALAEVTVQGEMAPGLMWKGRIDAVIRRGSAVTLVDFKTGAPSPTDMEQLSAYACLFDRDPQTRALGEVSDMAVLYARGGVVEVAAPRGEALEVERARFARETEDTRRRLALTPPEARPAAERCPRCDVRARCGAYWSARSSWEDDPAGGRRTIDAELIVEAVLGGGTALLARGEGRRWLVRVAPSHAEVVREFRAGAIARVAGASMEARDAGGDEFSADVVAAVGMGGAIGRPG